MPDLIVVLIPLEYWIKEASMDYAPVWLTNNKWLYDSNNGSRKDVYKEYYKGHKRGSWERNVYSLGIPEYQLTRGNVILPLCFSSSETAGPFLGIVPDKNYAHMNLMS